MANFNNINSLINRIADGEYTDADITALRNMLSSSDAQALIQLGKYNVNITDGKEIHIGDRIYQQLNEEAIQALVKAIQKVNWQCVANLTENDYT